jgi:3-phenylpropionate/trans-cinnamate dioxygenase alpha subunit
VGRDEAWWWRHAAVARVRHAARSCPATSARGTPRADDGENWSQSTAQSHGLASRRAKHLVNMGVGRGRIVKEHGLARIEGLTSEHGQRWTYHAWAEWMKGTGWDALRAATTPGAIP